MAEILAMEMKSAGMYVSRGLSYKQAEVRLVTLFILNYLLFFKLMANSTCLLTNMQSVFYSRFLASYF